MKAPPFSWRHFLSPWKRSGEFKKKKKPRYKKVSKFSHNSRPFYFLFLTFHSSDPIVLTISVIATIKTEYVKLKINPHLKTRALDSNEHEWNLKWKGTDFCQKILSLWRHRQQTRKSCAIFSTLYRTPCLTDRCISVYAFEWLSLDPCKKSTIYSEYDLRSAFAFWVRAKFNCFWKIVCKT